MKLSTKKTLWSAVVSVVVLGSVAAANSVTLPNTFQPNTPARAAEVNANFAAVKAAVDDNQAQLTTLTAKLGTRVFRHSSYPFTLTATGGAGPQVTIVDVPLGTATTSGVFEVRLQVFDVNAYWAGTPEWNLSVAPVLNGIPGSPSQAAVEFFGSAIKPPLLGSVSFNVSANQVVAARVRFETSSACTGGRGGSTSCHLGLNVDAHFTPGIALE